MSAPEDLARRHRLLTRLFLQARGIAPAARVAWLDAACGDDGRLRAELVALLAADADGGGDDLLPPEGTPAGDAATLQSLVRASGAFAAPGDGQVDAVGDGVPARIGTYRPRAVLGRGASAIVYLAEAEAPRQDVALKVLRGDVAPEAAARIEREADLLARLEHPGIARIFAAGRAATPWGEQGYIAMELVNGRPLLDYARAEALSLRARVALVADVAEALQVAHRFGVVHRDLKPSNILVQADGSPKLLDFGVARVRGGAGPGSGSLHTRTGQIVGTLATMAPEQAAGAPDVDARADVYALGVVLYELCAGRLPIDTRGLPLHEAVRRIQNEDPVPLGIVRPELAGDVETIVQHALEKEPARRYADAGELAADLRRHLAGEQIRARPQRARDRARRFVRRHRPLVAGVGVAFTALLVALVVSLFLLDRARSENRRAGRGREAALRLTDLRRLEQLEASARDLWPATPARLAAFDDWLAEADLLAGKLGWHRALLDVLDERFDSPVGRERLAQPDAMEAKITDELWMRRAQVDLVAGLAAFAAPGGTYERVQARREFAAGLRARSLEAHASAWAAAAEAMPGLRPHLGLVPIATERGGGPPTFRLLVPGVDGAGEARGPQAGAPAGTVLVYLGGAGGEPGVFVATAPVGGALWAALEDPPRPDAVPAPDPAAGDPPRVLVSRAEAGRFVARLGARLPTEDEYERLLARGLVAAEPALREWIEETDGDDGVIRRGARRERIDPLTRASDLGFRLVVDPEGP